MAALIFAISLVCFSLFFLLFSFCGLWPTKKLGLRKRGPLTINHFLALQLIIALTYAYTNYFLRLQTETLFLPMTVGCWCVEVVWWPWVARRANNARNAFYVLLYVTSTVLLAFIGPAMIMIHAALLLKEGLFFEVSAMVVIHLLILLLLYLAVFWTTSKFIVFTNASQTLDGA
ncbi:MAG: hypothetical protein AAGG48_25680 [Planctomycetota bacterium]